MGLISKVLETAAGEVGQMEVPKGKNIGPRVTMYQNRTGYPGGGVPWCLCFCYWSVDEVCRNAEIKNVLRKTGSCDLLLEWAKAQNVFHTVPKVGDIALLLAQPGSSDAVHAFLVAEVNATGISTIEGNSNNDGSNEGYMVVRHTRSLSSRIVYARWADMPGFAGVDDKVDSPVEPLETAKVNIEGNLFGTFEVLDGQTMVPIRDFLEKLEPAGQNPSVEVGLAWNPVDRTITMDGKTLSGQVLQRNGVTYAHVRKVLEFANTVFGTARTISLSGSDVNIS